MDTAERSGLLAGGNFIIDHVKIIGEYPKENMLASILDQSSSNGGGPYNILVDLSKMGAAFPLAAAGLVGRDADGDWILEDCRRHGIDAAQLRQTDEAPTSYTDAMTVQSTGRRTFFHQRGANALLEPDGFDFSVGNARLFHLAYLLLLDALDELRPGGTTGAADVLAAARASGMITSADIVSAEHELFRPIVEAALPHLDYLVLNEIEAGKITGLDLEGAGTAGGAPVSRVTEAAQALLDGGIHRAVVIHFEAGAVGLEKEGASHVQGSLSLPGDFIAGATGAGDAFAAGLLYGIHEGWALAESLRLAVCAAAACLSHPATSEGLRPLEDCLELGSDFGFRELEGDALSSP